jgi:aryl-alcohol dehydrogenase-like predicted oxidoreductase
MVNRREFLEIAAGAGAALALAPELLRAHQQSAGMLMQRAIPSSGENLPVISFGPRPTAPPAPGPFKPMPTDVPAAKEVLKTFFDNGGKVVDVMHGGPIGEQAARTAADELGTPNEFFWTTSSVSIPNTAGPLLPGVVPKADPAVVRARLEEKFAQLKAPKIDLVMVSTLADAPTHLAVLREMKKEGRVRYVGVHHLAWPRTDTRRPPFSELEAIMRNEQIDFVGTDYSAVDRRAEETILPLARERKIAFMAYFPFDRGRLFKRADTTPLPDWGAEFDAKTWAQFFIKYVVSHPAVTLVRTGTTKGAHMLDNIGGGIGRLPNEAMRKQMAQLVDTFPAPPPPSPAPSSAGGRTVITAEQVQQQQVNVAPTVALSAAILNRYVGEYKHVAVGTMVTIRRDGDRLLVKVHGSSPEEMPFVARSETRFASATIFTLEFQLDAQGKVTGAVWEQGSTRIPLERM